MSLKVNVSGTWKYLSKAYVKVSDAWKPCTNIHVNINGTWKPLYSYKWSTGNWGTCSAECGGGTQTRTVTCQRYHASNSSLDIQTVEDSFCTKAVGTKPATSQSCNTQDCNPCYFEVTNIDISTTNIPSCTNTEEATYAWQRIDDSSGLTHIDRIDIYWDGIAVTSGSGYIDGSTLVTIINGYRYARSTYKGECHSTMIIPPASYYTTYNYWFQVCRTVV
nr:MAG TPA: Thrombospondin type 1 repeat protein [Caudoviricetes sp.]